MSRCLLVPRSRTEIPLLILTQRPGQYIILTNYIANSTAELNIDLVFLRTFEFAQQAQKQIILYTYKNSLSRSNESN